MDESTITLIVGTIASAIAGVIAKHLKSQQASLNAINEQSVILEKEGAVMNRILIKEKEREGIMREVHILILDTNLHILDNTRIVGASIPDEDVYEKTKQLKAAFTANGEALDELTKEYQMVRELSKEIKASTPKSDG